MKSLPLIAVVITFSAGHASGELTEAAPTNSQKAIRAMRSRDIRANIPSEKLFDVCIPTAKRSLGPFTEYLFEVQAGYWGITIIARDGVLKRALEWSCTHTSWFFDEMTSVDEKEYTRLCNENDHVPFERCHGRWGWQRLRMRDWGPSKSERSKSTKNEPAAPSK